MELSKLVICKYLYVSLFRLANKAWLKVAEIAAIHEDYPRAIAKYELVAKNSLGNNLTKWSLKDYFFRAGVCHIANKVRVLLLRGFTLKKENSMLTVFRISLRPNVR